MENVLKRRNNFKYLINRTKPLKWKQEKRQAKQKNLRSSSYNENLFFPQTCFPILNHKIGTNSFMDDNFYDFRQIFCVHF